VTGLALGELEELEPVEPALLLAEFVEPELLVVVVLAVRCLAGAGSWPDTSCTKITLQAKTKLPAAAASARLRIRAIRLRRARRRSPTRESRGLTTQRTVGAPREGGVRKH
jgi:hypothetical protein